MRKTTLLAFRTPLALAAVAAALVAGTALPASATETSPTGNTVTTFTLTGGDLSLSAPGTATLTDGAATDATVSGSLGEFSVLDERAVTAGWDVAAVSSAFSEPTMNGPTSSDVLYTATPVDFFGGIFAATTGSQRVQSAAASVLTGTQASGSNSALFTADLTVLLPGSALAGNYSGTVTTSVT